MMGLTSLILLLIVVCYSYEANIDDNDDVYLTEDKHNLLRNRFVKELPVKFYIEAQKYLNEMADKQKSKPLDYLHFDTNDEGQTTGMEDLDFDSDSQIYQSDDLTKRNDYRPRAGKRQMDTQTGAGKREYSIRPRAGKREIVTRPRAGKRQTGERPRGGKKQIDEQPREGKRGINNEIRLFDNKRIIIEDLENIYSSLLKKEEELSFLNNPSSASAEQREIESSRMLVNTKWRPRAGKRSNDFYIRNKHLQAGKREFRPRAGKRNIRFKTKANNDLSRTGRNDIKPRHGKRSTYNSNEEYEVNNEQSNNFKRLQRVVSAFITEELKGVKEANERKSCM